MPRIRRLYDLTRRMLYGTNMSKLSRDTGIQRQTLYNRRDRPDKTTLSELAQIVKARGLTAEEVMLILKDCT